MLSKESISHLLATGISVKFTELDYRATEKDKQMTVTVQTHGRRATPVAVRVTPMNYDDYLALGNSLPIYFPPIPAHNAEHPNRAGSMTK